MAGNSVPYSSGGGGGGSYQMAVGGFTGSTTEAIGNRTRLTNLDTRADTWGQPISRTWGTCRVAGNMIWSSKFYTTLTKFKKTTTWTNVENNLSWNGVGDPTIVTEGSDVSVFEEGKTGIDVSYSFGEEGDSRARRVVRKMRINGTLVFDSSTAYVFPGLGFNFRYGYDDDTIEPTMASYETGKYYYPDQTYVTLNNFPLGEWGNATPQSIDVEFGTDISINDPTIVPTQHEFAGSHERRHWAASATRKIYVLYLADQDGGVPGVPSIRVFSMDDNSFIEQIILSGPALPALIDMGDQFANDNFNGVSAKLEVIFGARLVQTEVVVIDLKTGIVTAFQLPQVPYSLSCGFLSESETAAEWITYPLVFTDNPYKITISRANEALVPSVIAIPKPVPADAELNGYIVGQGKGRVLMLFNELGTLYLYNGAYTLINVPNGGAGTPVINKYFINNDNIVVIYQINGDTFVGLFSVEGALLLQKPLPGGLDGSVVPSNYHQANERGIAGWTSGFNVLLLNLNTLSLITKPFFGPDNIYFFDGKDLKFLYAQYGYTGGYADRLTIGFVVMGAPGGKITLISFLESLYIEAGVYTEAQINNVDIDDEIIGALVIEPRSLTEIVESVCALYRIEYEESSAGITFYRSRDLLGVLDIKAVIPADELAMQQQGGNGQAALQTNRAAEAEQAGEITLKFVDPDNDYKGNEVTARRASATLSSRKITISVPIVMTSVEAASLVQNLLSDTKASRITHKFRLPPRYNRLTKGDIIRITHGVFSEVIRITQDDLNGDYSVSCEGEGVATSVRVSIVTTPEPDRNPSPGTDLAASVAIVIDAPTLTIEDDRGADKFIIYESVIKDAAGNWPGGYLARSVADTAYGTLFNVGSASPAVVYRASSVLTNKRWVIDDDDLTAAAISGFWLAANNKTQNDIILDNNINLAYYGTNGRWEVIQFASYAAGKFSTIIRGLRGTEINAGLHEIGDLIVIPTLEASIVVEARPIALAGTSEVYKAVTAGQAFGNTAAEDPRVIAANSARPFAPGSVQASRDGAGDVTVTWDRRDRLGTGWGASVLPLSEAAESYRVWIEDDAGEIVRTLADVPGPQATYSAADQVTDGTDDATSLLIRVAQIGAVGPGFSEVKQCPLT